ncbi:MAG: hypothetical protein QNJ12_21150 [Ilumatobacter sp.]|uniref:hypothetical protein n=1 Tax=Ilumatobacter sp. TaxID=1967498 RepID=UPI00261CEA23|nr:hypothetical protein [Ilumatobacter sp.]MDJ0771309.1 hypothetical protein [Ilumatobacter sp.]
MGRFVDLDDLVDAGEVAGLLGLAQRNSVTTYMKRYKDFPDPVLEFADGKCRAWLRKDIESWRAGRSGQA